VRSVKLSRKQVRILGLGAIAVAGTLTAVLAMGGARPLELRTIATKSVRELGMTLSQPSALDRLAPISASSALVIAQRSNPEMGPVKEEVLARVRWTYWGPPSDCTCWVLVKPAGPEGPTDEAGHSKVFEIIVIDAVSGKVNFAGGAMAGGGSAPS
jgi:hypothetical protein